MYAYTKTKPYNITIRYIQLIYIHLICECFISFVSEAFVRNLHTTNEVMPYLR